MPMATGKGMLAKQEKLPNYHPPQGKIQKDPLLLIMFKIIRDIKDIKLIKPKRFNSPVMLINNINNLK